MSRPQTTRRGPQPPNAGGIPAFPGRLDSRFRGNDEGGRAARAPKTLAADLERPPPASTIGPLPPHRPAGRQPSRRPDRTAIGRAPSSRLDVIGSRSPRHRPILPDVPGGFLDWPATPPATLAAPLPDADRGGYRAAAHRPPVAPPGSTPIKGATSPVAEASWGEPQPADAGGTPALLGTASGLPVCHYPSFGAGSPKLRSGPGEGG